VRLLVVEDEQRLARALQRGLAAEGFVVDLAHDGPRGLDMARHGDYDAMILDVMLPGLSGYRVVRQLRAERHWLPVLMLSAKDGEYDQADGLDCGADDYLTKPFSYIVLLARLRALLRRAAPPPDASGDPPLQVAELRVDPAARRVWWAAEELQLSKTEFDLLELLARNEGLALDHSTVYERIWGYDFGPDSKNLPVYIGYLRRKLAAAGAPPLIHTLRGVGYTLRKP